MGLMIITCLTKNPDIFFLSLGHGESHPRYGDVDSHQTRTLNCEKSLNMNYKKEGSDIVQILSGKSNGGFSYVTVE